MTMQKQFINVVALGLVLLSLASCGSNNKSPKGKQKHDSPPPGGSATVALVSEKKIEESASTCDTLENVSTDSELPRGGQDTTEAKNKAEAEAYLQKLWKTIPRCAEKMRADPGTIWAPESEQKFSKNCSNIVKYCSNDALPELVKALYPATGGNKKSARQFLKLVIILGNVDGKTTMQKKKTNGHKYLGNTVSTTVQDFMNKYFKREEDIAYWKDRGIDLVEDKGKDKHWGYSDLIAYEAKNKAATKAYLQKLLQVIPTSVNKMRADTGIIWTPESEQEFSKNCSDIAKYCAPDAFPRLVQALYPATGGNKESTRQFLKLVIILGNVDGKTTMQKSRNGTMKVWPKSVTVQDFMNEHFKREEDIAKDIAYWKDQGIDLVKDESNTHWGYRLAPAS